MRVGDCSRADHLLLFPPPPTLLTMALDLSPKILLMNFAHTGLQKYGLKADGPWFRVVGVFHSKQQAQTFSTQFTKEYGVGCNTIKIGVEVPIPSSDAFRTDAAYLPMRLDAIREHFKEQQAYRHTEYMQHTKEYETKKDKVEELRYAQTQTKKMLRARKKDLENSKKLIETRRQRDSSDDLDSNNINEKFKGIYKFFTVSCCKDPSAKREHSIQIHSVHRTLEEAKDHCAVLEKKIVYNDVDVVEMYQWIQVEMKFHEHLMEQVPRKYRDKIQNDLMQYQILGKKQKKEEILYERKKLNITTKGESCMTIEPDLPDYTTQEGDDATTDPREVFDVAAKPQSTIVPAPVDAENEE